MLRCAYPMPRCHACAFRWQRLLEENRRFGVVDPGGTSAANDGIMAQTLLAEGWPVRRGARGGGRGKAGREPGVALLSQGRLAIVCGLRGCKPPLAVSLKSVSVDVGHAWVGPGCLCPLRQAPAAGAPPDACRNLPCFLLSAHTTNRRDAMNNPCNCQPPQRNAGVPR